MVHTDSTCILFIYELLVTLSPFRLPASKRLTGWQSHQYELLDWRLRLRVWEYTQILKWKWNEKKRIEQEVKTRIATPGWLGMVNKGYTPGRLLGRTPVQRARNAANSLKHFLLRTAAAVERIGHRTVPQRRTPE